MMWSGIQRDQIDAYWPDALKMLGPAIEKSPAWFTPEHVFAKLKSGEFQLWMTHDGVRPFVAVVTEIVGSNCRLQILGGRDLNASFEVLKEAIVPWARAQGCDGMTCYPRAGLIAKFLKPQRFQFVKKTEMGDLYYKDLESDDTRVQ